MKALLRYRINCGLAFVVAAMLTGAAQAGAKCGACGAELGAAPVVVGDWETNREQRYHDLSCAVREMAARLPWSRAVVGSAVSGERITLTRINTTWRADPEEAVFAKAAQGEGECERVLVFADADEFAAYRAKHAGAIADATALAQIAPRSAAAAAAEAKAKAKGAEPAQGQGIGAPGFPDVPGDHWAAKSVEKAKALGLMRGYPDGTFRGNKAVTRYEMSAILDALAQGGLPTSGAASGEAAQVDRLIEIALEENAELAALRSEIAAERAKVPQARTLPDPMLGISFDDLLRPGRGMMVEARQMVPWPGKLRLMSRAAALTADRAVTQYTEKAYQVVSQVKTAYYDLYFVDRSTQLALSNKDVLADFVKIAEAKYSVGAGIQQDVLRAQVAQSRMVDELLMLRQQQAAAAARLNALLNRPPDAPVATPAVGGGRRVALDQRALEEMALQRRAMLKGMRLMTEEARTMHALAWRELKPDFEARVGVVPGSEMNPDGGRITGMVMLVLPLYHHTKQDKAIEQRAAEVKSAQSGYESQKTMAFAMIREALAMLEKSDRSAALYETGIIPQAQMALESARAGYQVGKVDFLALLDGRVALHDAYREYYRAVTDYEKGVAELERTVGAPLEAGEVKS